MDCRKRILCIDDLQDNCDLFQFVLSNVGYEVETAQTVAEGLAKAQCCQFDLYLIDLHFSDGSGFDLLEKIRAFDLTTPIMVCSGDVRDWVQERVLKLGGQVFLLKPIDSDNLIQAIADLFH